MTTNSNKSGGVGFFGLLTLLFIALKLTGAITWSWFWVLSPLLFGFSLIGVIFVIAFIVALVEVSR
jgi:hypothetical protein